MTNGAEYTFLPVSVVDSPVPVPEWRKRQDIVDRTRCTGDGEVAEPTGDPMEHESRTLDLYLDDGRLPERVPELPPDVRDKTSEGVRQAKRTQTSPSSLSCT